jgi:hypothetical protein
MGTDKMMPRHVCDKSFMFKFPNRGEWKDRFQPSRKGRLAWYADTSKINEGSGAGVYGYGMRKKLGSASAFGQYTIAFQAEVYAIKACAVENLGRVYRNRNISILSNSQDAVKLLTITRSTKNLFGTAINL